MSATIELAYGLFQIVVALPPQILSKADWDPGMYVCGISAVLNEHGIKLERRRRMALIHTDDQDAYAVYCYSKDSIDSERLIAEADYEPVDCSLKTIFKVLRTCDPGREEFGLRTIKINVESSNQIRHKNPLSGIKR